MPAARENGLRSSVPGRKETMFNLEKAIEEWKRELRSSPAFEDGDVEELESHVRERVGELRSEGMSHEEAFEKTIDEIGPVDRLNEEWNKARFSSKVRQQKYSFRQSLFTLFPSYVVTAVRNIRKRFAYSFINIVGLGTGLATCLLILFFVDHELSYDTFHADADRIYRVVNSTADDGQPTNANGSYAAGPLLKQDYPNEVEEYGRLSSTVHNSKMYVAFENRKFYEEHFYFADPGFLKIFNFPLIEGDPETALSRPNTLVLTVSTARKYFGEENPLGKTITADPYQNGNLMEFEVTGLMKDLPSNTHLNFDFLASYDSQTPEGINSSLAGFNGVYTYLKLAPSASPEQLEAKFSDFQANHWNEDPWYTMSLQPMTDIHLESQLKSEIAANGNSTYVYIFGAVAILILAIACVNFINLTTARSTERAKEVGLRKAIGAHKMQLVGQFLGEALMLTLLSGVIAVLFVYLFLPQFNNLTQKDLELATFITTTNVLGYMGLLLVVGLAAGFYPALVLSSFKSVEVLKSNYKAASGGEWLRKGLVISQFAISAVLIVSTIVIYQQIEYINSKSLGYAREQILTIPLNPEARDNLEVLKSEWIRHSGVVSVTTSSHVPTSGTSHSTFRVSGIEESLSMARFYIDENFVETYDLKLLAGTDISTPVTEPGHADFLMTERKVRSVGFERPEEMLGRTVNWDEFSGSVKGVVNDMILYDLRQEPYSIMFFITPVQYHKFISIRINTAQTQQALAHIGEVWDSQVASYPLDYSFLDDKFEAMHLSDQKMAETVTYFALLAIVIACLGLFGLAAYLAERKRKEIGIRKVLGATIPQIIGLLSFDFMKLVSVALLLGIPVAYWGMSSWLQGFVYKIDMGAAAFVYAGLVLLVISFSTISWQAIKSARMNPVKSLESE